MHKRRCHVVLHLLVLVSRLLTGITSLVGKEFFCQNKLSQNECKMKCLNTGTFSRSKHANSPNILPINTPHCMTMQIQTHHSSTMALLTEQSHNVLFLLSVFWWSNFKKFWCHQRWLQILSFKFFKSAVWSAIQFSVWLQEMRIRPVEQSLNHPIASSCNAASSANISRSSQSSHLKLQVF